MGIVNFILNLAGVLFWLNWRSNRFDPLVRRPPATLMGTLRPAAPQKLRRWHLLALIMALLVVRAVIYWVVGREANWSGKLDLGLTVPCFSSAYGSHWMGFYRMITFSFLSFGLTLGIFYVCLLPFSLLAGPMPVHGLVTIPLGRLDRWPRWLRVILPWFVTGLLWCGTSWLLSRMEVLNPLSLGTRLQQSLVIGASSYLLWQFPLAALLVLHLLNSYIYFGKHPFWNYVDATSHTLLKPLHRLPLQLRKVDFAPLLGLGLLFLLARMAQLGLYRLYLALPL